MIHFHIHLFVVVALATQFVVALGEERENNIPIEKPFLCVGILFSHNSLSTVCSVCSVCSRLVIALTRFKLRR